MAMVGLWWRGGIMCGDCGRVWGYDGGWESVCMVGVTVRGGEPAPLVLSQLQCAVTGCKARTHIAQHGASLGEHGSGCKARDRTA